MSKKVERSEEGMKKLLAEIWKRTTSEQKIALLMNTAKNICSKNPGDLSKGEKKQAATLSKAGFIKKDEENNWIMSEVTK